MAEDSLDLGTPAPSATSAADEETYPFDFIEEDTAPDPSPDPSVASDGSGPSDAPSNIPTNPSVPATERFDVLRTSIDTLPESVRSYATQAQAQQRELHTSFSRVSEELAHERNQREQERTQYLEALRQPAPAAAPATDPMRPIYDRLGEEERGAITTVDEMINIRMQEHVARVTALEEQNASLQQGVQAQEQRSLEAQSVAINQEIAVARQAYPNADFLPWGGAIRELRATLNPGTNQPFSFIEAYQRLTGETAAQSEQLQAQETQQRRVAQSKVSHHTVDSAVPSGNTELTQDEVLDGLGRLSFE
jgi:hypothetical protein